MRSFSIAQSTLNSVMIFFKPCNDHKNVLSDFYRPSWHTFFSWRNIKYATLPINIHFTVSLDFLCVIFFQLSENKSQRIKNPKYSWLLKFLLDMVDEKFDIEHRSSLNWINPSGNWVLNLLKGITPPYLQLRDKNKILKWDWSILRLFSAHWTRNSILFSEWLLILHRLYQINFEKWE